MYRDDMEALQARMRTLHAELEAERRSRSAAEAAAQAARAAADEAELKLRRQDGAPEPIWRRHWSAAVVVVIALVIGAVWMVRSSAMQARAREEVKAAGERSAALHKHLETLQTAYDRLQGRCNRLAQERTSHRVRPISSSELESRNTLSSGARYTLSRAQIQGGMRAVKPRVQECFDRYKVPGMANVQVKIMPSGLVGKAKTVGMFTGTPTGNCVQAAVREARFPAFDGAPITITYPYVLR